MCLKKCLIYDEIKHNFCYGELDEELVGVQGYNFREATEQEKIDFENKTLLVDLGQKHQKNLIDICSIEQDLRSKLALEIITQAFYNEQIATLQSRRTALINTFNAQIDEIRGVI